MSNIIQSNNVYQFTPSSTESNLINLKRFRYSLSSKKLSTNLINQRLDDALLEEIKTDLKENYPELVRNAFGDQEKKKELYEVISSLISSKQYIEKHKEAISKNSHDLLVSMLVDSIAGLDVLEELLKRPTITDININAYDDIWIDDYMTGEEKTDLKFESKDAYIAVLNKLMNEAKTSWSHTKPQAKGSLPQLRFDIVGFDISDNVTCSIRVHSKELRINKESMLKTKQASIEMISFFEEVMKTKIKLIVSGQTGAGKTELMKWLVSLIPKGRIISIEDLKELFLKNKFPDKNISEWTTRESLGSDERDWDLGELTKFALRHYPKYLIIGETRGKELFHMIKAAQTGHGLLSGIHSDDAEEQIDRMIDLMKEFANDSEESYGKKLTRYLNLGAHTDRVGENKTRTITKLVEFEGYENGKEITRTLFEYDYVLERHVIKNPISDKLYKILLKETSVDLNKIDFILPSSVAVV